MAAWSIVAVHHLFHVLLFSDVIQAKHLSSDMLRYLFSSSSQPLVSVVSIWYENQSTDK